MADGPPIALFWGDDAFLVEEAARGFLRGHGVHAVEVDGREWQGGEAADLATPSLWGEKRGLLLLRAQGLPEHGIREVHSYLEAAAADAILAITVVTGGKGPPALAKRVDASGGLVRRVSIRRQDLTGWLMERAAGRSVKLTGPGAGVLVATLGSDPATLDQAVEQLTTAFPNSTIGPDQVRAQFQGQGDPRVWDLCDSAFAGRTGEALVILRSLLEGRDDPLIILGGVASRLRDLMRVGAVPARLPAAEAARAAGLRFDWQVRRYREQAGRLSPEGMIALHRRVVDADRALKGGASPDVVLPALVAAMAGQPEAALDLPLRVGR